MRQSKNNSFDKNNSNKIIQFFNENKNYMNNKNRIVPNKQININNNNI